MRAASKRLSISRRYSSTTSPDLHTLAAIMAATASDQAALWGSIPYVRHLVMPEFLGSSVQGHILSGGPLFSLPFTQMGAKLGNGINKVIVGVLARILPARAEQNVLRGPLG